MALSFFLFVCFVICIPSFYPVFFPYILKGLADMGEDEVDGGGKHTLKHTHRQTGVTPLRDQWKHVPHTTAVVIRPHTRAQMCATACGAQREMAA